MFKNKKFFLIVIGALALTLAFGMVAFIPIETASAAELAGHGGPRGDRGGRHGFGNEDPYLAETLGITTEELQAAREEARSNFEGPDSETDMDTLLAEALGIGVDELLAAQEAAREAAIEQALADGKITEEQVAIMEARQALQKYLQKDELLAKSLGISVEELEAYQEEGLRTPDLIEELGIAEEDFQTNMQAAREEALQQAVEDGIITQEQANEILEDGFGHEHGHGKHGGRPNGQEPRSFPNCPENSSTEE
jgi:hypothetical protein